MWDEKLRTTIPRMKVSCRVGEVSRGRVYGLIAAVVLIAAAGAAQPAASGEKSGEKRAQITILYDAFGKASVSALATPRELALVNYLGWASVMLAIAAGLAGGAWGLAGVIYGVALGWLLRAIAAFYVIGRHLRLPVTVPATTP